MNCKNSIYRYTGSSTFTLDNKTYNKVKVTNMWNKIGIRYFDNSTKETKYFNTYSVPVGEYDHIELFDAILSCFNQFASYTGGKITVSGRTQNMVTTGTNPLPSKTYTSFRNFFQFGGDCSHKGGIYVEIVNVPNGIQEILPFTLPIPTVPEPNSKYVSRSAFDNRWSAYIAIFNQGYLFDMIWLNPLFFNLKDVNIEYPNNIIGFACNHNTNTLFSDIKTGSPNSYLDNPFTIPTGIFTEYGYLIAILTGLVNSASVAGGNLGLRYAIFKESDGVYSVQRTGSDGKWALCTSSSSITSVGNYLIEDFSTERLNLINTFTIDLTEYKIKLQSLGNMFMYTYSKINSL